MKIYTKTGDSGTTGLFGGDRVPKNDIRIESYGTVDELNAFVGSARTAAQADDRLDDIDRVLARIQDELFVVGADLATPTEAKPTVPRVTSDMVTRLEAEIDEFDGRLPALRNFILPGGSELASRLHICRTVCRRSERAVVAGLDLNLNPEVARYLNRLADHLFVLARVANQLEGVDAPEWHP